MPSLLVLGYYNTVVFFVFRTFTLHYITLHSCTLLVAVFVCMFVSVSQKTVLFGLVWWCRGKVFYIIIITTTNTILFSLLLSLLSLFSLSHSTTFACTFNFNFNSQFSSISQLWKCSRDNKYVYFYRPLPVLVCTKDTTKQ